MAAPLRVPCPGVSRGGIISPPGVTCRLSLRRFEARPRCPFQRYNHHLPFHPSQHLSAVRGFQFPGFSPSFFFHLLAGFHLQFQLEISVRKIKTKTKTKKKKEKKLTPTVNKGMGLLGVGGIGGRKRKYLGVKGESEGCWTAGGKREKRFVGADRGGSHSTHQFLLAVSCWTGSWSWSGSRRRFRSNSTSAISSFSLLYFSMSKRVLFTPLWKNSRYCLSLASG